MHNLFLHTAEFYDLDVRSIATDDIPFYREWAAAAGGGHAEVLELACGTGRVAIPLAIAGHQVTGIDLSPKMLELFAAKGSRLDDEVAGRLEIIHGDMSSFDLEHGFDLVIIPFRGFQALTEPEEIHGCLARARAHLKPGGVFIVDVFRPYPAIEQVWPREEQHEWTHRDPETGRTIVRTRRHRVIDAKAQIIYPEIHYYVREAGGAARRYSETLKLRYWYRHQLQLALVSHGFRIEHEYGYYDGRPPERGPDLIAVCRGV